MTEPETPTAERTQAAKVLMGMLGALLLGAGLISVLAHNWDDYPRSIRLLFSFLPLMAAQAGSFAVLRREVPTAAWVRESLALLQTLATGACIALVSQIYNLGGEWPDFLFWWFLLCLPLVWVMRSSAVAVFYLWATAQWAVHQSDNGVWYQSAMIYPLLLAGLFPFWPGWRFDRPLSIPLRWVMSLSALIGLCAAAYASVRGRENDYSFFRHADCLWVLTAAALMLLPMSRAGVASPLRQKPHIVLGGMIVVGVTLFATMGETTGYWTRAFAKGMQVPWAWMLIAVLVVFAIMALNARRALLVAVASASVILVLAAIGVEAQIIQWAMNTHLFLVGVSAIGVELTGRKGAPILGTLLVCALVAARFADSTQSLLAKGITFLIAGAALLALVVITARRTRPTS